MAFQDQPPGDIHATLAVSQEEARFGSSRVINLPGGRTTTVVVPAGIRDGQELRLPGQGSASSAQGRPGDLVLRVLVVADSGSGRSGDDFATERGRYSSPPISIPLGNTGDQSGPAGTTQRSLSADDATEAASGGLPLQSQSGYPGPGGYQSNPAYGQSALPPRSFSADDATEAASGGLPPQSQSGYPGPGGYQSNPAYGQSTPPPPQSYPDPGGYQSNPAYGQSAPPPPQAYPNVGGYPTGSPASYPPQPVQSTPAYPVPPVQPSKPRRGGATTVLILVIALLLIVGGGLAFYLGYYQPTQAHTSATQTAQTQANAAATGTAQVVRGTANAIFTSTAQVQATVQTYLNVLTRATSGTPAVDDPLSSPTINPFWDVTVGGTADGGCAFTGGSYHSTIPTAGFFQPCYALGSNYSNFALQVDMTIVRGDEGGVLLRASSDHNKFYLFRLNVDGSFDFYDYPNKQGSQAILLLTGSSKAMNGLNQSNEVTIVAQGTMIYFYLNRQYLGSVNDRSYNTGEIGLFAESAKNPTDVAFRNAKIWTL